jgi:peptidoglycan-associated lipoprotein
MRKISYVVVTLMLALFQLNCATNKSVKKEVSRIDKEMDTLEASVETNESRIKEHDATLADQGTQVQNLSQEAKDALARAQSAEKLAQGKLLYEVTLSDDAVKFGFDKTEISPKAKEVLDNLVGQLKAENKNVYIEIQGYTDSVGNPQYNMKLGLERAEAVRRYLSQEGIPLHRLNTISYGETNPITDNKTREGRSKNRRVVLVVLA